MILSRFDRVVSLLTTYTTYINLEILNLHQQMTIIVTDRRGESRQDFGHFGSMALELTRNYHHHSNTPAQEEPSSSFCQIRALARTIALSSILEVVFSYKSEIKAKSQNHRKSRAIPMEASTNRQFNNVFAVCSIRTF